MSAALSGSCTNRKCASVVRRLFFYISLYAPEDSTYTHAYTYTYRPNSCLAICIYIYTHTHTRLFPCKPFRLLRLNRPTRRDGRRIKHDLKVEEFTLFNVYEKSALVPRGFHEIIICLIERRRMQIERVFPDNGIYYYELPHASPFVIKPSSYTTL